MRIVTAQELESWLASGKILEKDARGPKVIALNNGLFLKIFYTRRHPLLARLQPAAKRFSRNVERLQENLIATPDVVETFWLDRKKGLSACLYEPLPGTSVEHLYCEAPHEVDRLLASLADFIRRLHRQGIYFRSLHLGNILLMPDGDYGLIDILDLKCRKRPLSKWQIERNFKHLQNYLKRKNLTNFPIDPLIQYYWQSSESGS